MRKKRFDILPSLAGLRLRAAFKNRKEKSLSLWALLDYHMYIVARELPVGL